MKGKDGDTYSQDKETQLEEPCANFVGHLKFCGMFLVPISPSLSIIRTPRVRRGRRVREYQKTFKFRVSFYIYYSRCVERSDGDVIVNIFATSALSLKTMA